MTSPSLRRRANRAFTSWTMTRPASQATTAFGGRPDRLAPARRSGFSILELLLVLVILAVLAGIVAVNFGGQSEKARITAAKTQMGAFNLALDRFNMDLGRYPTTSEGLRALIEKPGDDTADKWQRYLKANDIPKDQWDRDWNYRQPGQHNTEDYDLWSNGPDGREGTEDDIRNWSTSATAVTR